jgi:hypothetical protein
LLIFIVIEAHGGVMQAILIFIAMISIFSMAFGCQRDTVKDNSLQREELMGGQSGTSSDPGAGALGGNHRPVKEEKDR